MVPSVNIFSMLCKDWIWLSFYIKVFFDKLKHQIVSKKEELRVCKLIEVLKIDNKVDHIATWEYETWTQKINKNYTQIITQGKYLNAFYINIYTLRDLEVFSEITNRVNVKRVHIEIKGSLINININTIFKILTNNHCFEVEDVRINVHNYLYLFRYCKFFSDKNLKKLKYLIIKLTRLKYIQINCECICCSHSHNLDYTSVKNTTRNKMLLNGEEIFI